MAEKRGNAGQDEGAEVTQKEPPVCGIVMPISDFQGRTADHWASVRDLIERAAEKAGTRPQAVWLGGSVDIIHDRIVHNLFSNDIVVADASALNPNVMFEIGMRLTYGRPTILIADDETSLPFDTHIIDHLIYPRLLNFHRIEIFISDLVDRIKGMLDAGDDYRPFISRFGPLDILKPETREVDGATIVADRLDRVESTLAGISRSLRRQRATELADRYSTPIFTAASKEKGSSLELSSYYTVAPSLVQDFVHEAMNVPNVSRIPMAGPAGSGKLQAFFHGTLQEAETASEKLRILAERYDL